MYHVLILVHIIYLKGLVMSVTKRTFYMYVWTLSFLFNSENSVIQCYLYNKAI